MRKRNIACRAPDNVVQNVGTARLDFLFPQHFTLDIYPLGAFGVESATRSCAASTVKLTPAGKPGMLDHTSTAVAGTLNTHTVDRKVNSVQAVDPADPTRTEPVEG